MPERSFPFDTQTTYQNDWLRFARLFTPSAVVGSPGTGAYDLTLSGFSASLSCRSDQSPAEAFVDGSMHQITYDAATSGRVALTVTPNADPANSRIDRVVLRRDPAARSVVLAILPGTPAASPVAATPTQIAGGLFEFPLWRFTVPPNSASTTSNPVDDRYYREAATGWQGIGAWGSGTSLPSSPADGTRYYHTGVRCTLTYAGGSWRQDDLPSVADAAAMVALQTSYPSVVTAGFQAFRQDLGQVWTWAGTQWQAAGSATQVDTFTASGSWAKPAGAKTVRVIAVGGGGGGSGGGSYSGTSSSTAGYGGGGGGGGGTEDALFDATSLPATVAVIVGAGGAGSAGSISSAGAGSNSAGAATAGSASTFGAMMSAPGGNGGQASGSGSAVPPSSGGSTGVASAVSDFGSYVGSAFYPGSGGGNGGANGAAPQNAPNAPGNARGAAGGGGGGGANGGGTGTTWYAGSAGGQGGLVMPAGTVGGGGGAGANTAPTYTFPNLIGAAGSNATATGRYAGNGGGGGAGSYTLTSPQNTIGGAGGNGLNGGGGGGGGGSGTTTTQNVNGTSTGGKGGNGGSGVVVCISYF